MNRLTGIISGFVLCQFWAPLDLINWPPLFKKIKVTKVSNLEAMDLTEIKLSKFTNETFKYNPAYHMPKRTVIHFDNDHDVNNIVINHETGSIYGTHNLHEPDGGIPQLGMYFFGLPGIIIFSPILITNSIVWNTLEKLSGMNRYALTFYLKTKSQLDFKTKNDLKMALRRI